MISSELRHRDEGFTLVELLVAMTLSLIVVLATLQALDLFTSNAAHQRNVNDANDQVRTVMDRTVTDLRSASAILRADGTDLVYSVPESSGGYRIERLCTSSSELYHSKTISATATAPTAACSTGAKVATLRSTASTAFTYDGSSSASKPELVKNVGLTLSLDASNPQRPATSTLQASAARRAASALLVTDDDLDVTCNSTGAMLSLSAAIPGIGALSVTYDKAGGISLGTPTGTTLQIPTGITSVLATITDAAGVTNTIQKDIQCDT